MTNPDVPAGLGPVGAAFWEEIMSGFVLDHHHEALLAGACRELDTEANAEAIIRAQGITTLDRFGQVKPHPAVDVARRARNSFRLLIRELGLDVEDFGSAAGGERRPPMAGANAHLRVTR